MIGQARRQVSKHLIMRETGEHPWQEPERSWGGVRVEKGLNARPGGKGRAAAADRCSQELSHMPSPSLNSTGGYKVAKGAALCSRSKTPALARWLSWLEHRPMHLKVAGSISGQGT